MNDLPPKRHANSARPIWTGEQFKAAVEKASTLAAEGLFIDGAHHKQWYLEQVLQALGQNLERMRRETGLEWDAGIAP